jgi:hypothetical protein
MVFDVQKREISLTSKERLKMHALDVGYLVLSENQALCVDHAYTVNPELEFSYDTESGIPQRSPRLTVISANVVKFDAFCDRRPDTWHKDPRATSH